jgi:hypothetical protein
MLFCVTHWEVQSKINAIKKFTAMVVNVKNRLIPACFHLLYFNKKRGFKVSINQKKVIPPPKINARCKEGIVSK